jgi:hypothetical protein
MKKNWAAIKLAYIEMQGANIRPPVPVATGSEV